ncbi:MAG: hypothetical protein EXR95_00710 [Gemmatimonadetes bacterium]|nr:hypothetical protein [Gemmatimonadota bacterium]
MSAPLPALSRARILLLVLGIAAATYANALGNGWAVDDEYIVRDNPVVTEGRWGDAVSGAYWTGLEAEPSLWRPTTLAVLTAQWQAFGGRPLAFHAVSLLLHALVSVLVVLLLAAVLPTAAAAAGGALFAAHPVHVEAVANVVGQSELLAAAFYLGACVLYLRTRDAGARARALRLPALALLYALAIGAKESGITLPGVLLLLGLVVPERRGEVPAPRRVRQRLVADLPVYVTLGAVAGAYLCLRVWVLGSVTGEDVPAELRALGTGARVLTALSLWPTYLRLLVIPFDLSSDYGPAVLLPATGVRTDVVAGALILAALGATALAARRHPWAALAAGWLVITVLPISHLLFPAGTMLGERTLYLPSVAVALAAGGGLALVATRRPQRVRLAAAAGALVVGVFLVRSVVRNPTWFDSFSVMSALAREHHESWRAHRSRAAGLVRAGDVTGALGEYDEALRLRPGDYAMLCEAGSLYKRQRQLAPAERLLTAAVRVEPDRPLAYRLLAELYLLAGDGRRAHATALAGLARWGSDHDLWALVSESYVAKGDLPAAVRARQAALAFDPSSASDRGRLAELLAAQSSAPADASAR